MKQKILSVDTYFNSAMDVIEGKTPIKKDIRIGVIHPSDNKKNASRTTTDRTKLIDCALMARHDLRKYFALNPLQNNPFD